MGVTERPRELLLLQRFTVSWAAPATSEQFFQISELDVVDAKPIIFFVVPFPFIETEL